MKARRKSALMALIILLSFFFPLSAYSEKDCQSIRKLMQTAVSIRDLDINLGTKEKKEPYIKELEDVLESLNFCKENVNDPFVNLEIDTLINSIEGRIKQVRDIPPHEIKNCQKCKDIEECIELCNEYRKKKEWWRKEYVKTIQGHDMLDCEKCLEDLEKYYFTIEDLLSRKELDANHIYSKESITALWGILYSISKDKKCLRKGQEKLRHIMLPFVMPPADLIAILSRKFKELDRKKQEELLERKEDAIYLINFLIEILRQTDTNILERLELNASDLAGMLARLIKKYPGEYDAVLIIPIIGLSPADDILTTLIKKFEELTNEERKKLLSRKDDALYLINFLIDVLRETDPDIAKKLHLEAHDLARLFSIIIENNPNDINKILCLLPAHDLLTLLSKRFKDLPTEEQEELLKRKKEDVRHIVKRFVEVYRKIDPTMIEKIFDGADGEYPPLKYKYLTSFLMPGYVRSYHEEEKTSGIVKAWNYSNIALLGLAVVSEAAYINTDYDNDALFHIGVTATVAFVVNGLLGVWDAALYETPKNNTAGSAITGPYISINGQYDEPALMFTFKF